MDAARLLEIMARLRNPESGCPWDVEQSFETIAPYTIEEAYEVDDAVRRGDLDALREELGDLLLQVAFHARIAEEAGAFDFGDVVAAICDKLVRRHPHVFGDAKIDSADAQTRAWEEHKAAERAAAASGAAAPGALDGVPLGLPALLRAHKLIGRARRAGFRWPRPGDALAKAQEELAELGAEVDSGDRARLRAELGDLLFALAGLARELELNAEDALREANAKFERRLGALEAELRAQGRSLANCAPEELLERWARRVR